MAEFDYRISVDAGSVINRFRETIPNITREWVITGMRGVVGKLEQKILQNIDTMFLKSHSETRGAHLHLREGLLGQVIEEGDLIIGRVSIALDEVPYARILEMGGVIPTHIIRPKNASSLKIPISTFTSGEAYERAEITTNGLYVLPYTDVHMPATNIVAYHFMLSALADLSKEAVDDIEIAVAHAIMRSS